MPDRDLIAEAQKLLSAQPSDAFAAYEWLRRNLPALRDALEAAQRPPLGYVVLAHYPGRRPYMPSAEIHDASMDAETEAAKKGSGPSGKWRYTLAEVREVPGCATPPCCG